MKMARPERFELPTSWFVARRSIQLSYGRKGREYYHNDCRSPFSQRTPAPAAASAATARNQLHTRVSRFEKPAPSPRLSRERALGGEGGIRTLEGLLTLTPLAGARLRPLGHLSGWDKPIRGARDDTRPEQSR